MTEDPGWGSMFRALLPGGSDRGRSRGSLTQIAVTRLVYLAFLVSFGILILAFYAIDPEPISSMSESTARVIVAGIALAGYLAVAGMTVVRRARIAPVADGAEAVRRIRTRMLMLLALSEPTAMFGLVLGFVTGSLTPYLLGLALAAPGFLVAAPTRATIKRFQESEGGAVDVFAALNEPASGSTEHPASPNRP